MLQGKHSAILLTFINLIFAINNLVLSIFKWPLKTGFTVFCTILYFLSLNINYFLRLLEQGTEESDPFLPFLGADSFNNSDAGSPRHQ